MNHAHNHLHDFSFFFSAASRRQIKFDLVSALILPYVV